MKIDKSLMKTSTGKLITEALFLEIGYRSFAVYTLKDEDFEYEGKLYPSIKKIYMNECHGGEDGEYDFAINNFVSWNHWRRICNNKKMVNFVQDWRDEVEVKVRAQGIKNIIKYSNKGNYNAAKWIAEGGFSKRKVGRPSKEDLESAIAIDKRLEEEYNEDIIRLNAHI